MMRATEQVAALRFPVVAELVMPGSKSHANRAIVCACLAEQTTVIRNATPCDDVSVMVANLQKMGFNIEWTNRVQGELTIEGGMPARKDEEVLLDCHNAGTTLRFLVSLACLIPGSWVLTGDENMQKRPIRDLVTALVALGAKINDTNGCPPLTIEGGHLHGSSAQLKASQSSQYLSSLLLIAPYLQDGLKIEVVGSLASSGYIDLTEKVMNDFGVRIERRVNTFIVQKKSYVCSSSYAIEGDWSAAGAWLVLNALTDSKISFANLSPLSSQSDRRLPDVIARCKSIGDITIDCSDIPDQLMNLAVLAAFRKGRTTLSGAKNLRIKECDRLAVITGELQKAGIQITDYEDGVIVEGGTLNKDGIVHSLTLDPHHDHRMAMCFAILGSKRSGISIIDPACVEKSYPQFFDHLRSLEKKNKPIVIVGMRGAGKSNLAKRLASRLGLQWIDIDKVFETEHGNIKEFVSKKGWQAFRLLEEELVEKSLVSGSVISLGGGATESVKTRNLLKQRACVLWIQASKEELIKRLRSEKRPSLTGLPLEDEVQKLLVERGPQYLDVADSTISSRVPYSKQVLSAIQSLRKIVS